MKIKFQVVILCLFLTSYAQAQSVSNNALPTNPNIESGKATITQSTNQLTINQSTDKLITNWSSFNIGKDATVQFNQPSSTSSALNRVNSNDPSYIFGSLKANGQVILINPSGVIFGQGARFDAGSFIASTLNLKSSDFLNNNYIFERDPNLQAGAIENNGSINAFLGGTVAFIAAKITNSGIISTPSGTTALLSGDRVTLSMSGNKLINYSVDVGTLNSLIENKNLITADDGVVILSAKAINSINKSVVNNTGIIEAKGITKQGGKVFLDGDVVTNTGTINVSSSTNKGGNIQITGDVINITSTSKLIAAGATGGGEILVGGSYQNLINTIRQAIRVLVEIGALLDASATENGNGGAIVVWSNIYRRDSETYANGTFIAKGGANGGDGGSIETSGFFLNTDNAVVDASSPKGNSGTWLLDPFDITIASSGATGTAYSSTFTAGQTSTILASSIETSLNAGTNVSITTADGSITFTTGISKTANNISSLALSAYVNVALGANSITSSLNTLPLTITATTGSFSGSGNLTLNGGALSITQGADGTYSGVISGVGTTLTKAGAGILTLSGGNSYTGVTAISAGALRAANVTALGTTAGGVTVASGAALELSGNIAIGAEDLTLNNAGISSGGALRNISGNNTYGGLITLASDSRINSDSGTLTLNKSTTAITGTYNLTFGGSGNTTVSTVIATSTGTLTKDGSGTLTLSAANTYTGLTTVSAGSLTYGIANAISSGDVTVNGSTAILNLATFTDTVGAVTLTEGSITSTTGVLTGTSYTLNPATGKTVTVSAILAGAVNLTKSDLGTANLSGVNTYSGTTTINASGGTLAITGAGQLGSGTYAQNIAIGSGSTFAYSSSATQTLSGIISGAGTFTKDTGSSSSLTLTNTNTYTGGTNANAGTLILDQSATTTGTVLADSGAVTVNGGTLQLNDVSETVGAVTLTSGSITVGTTGNTLTGTSYTLNPSSGTTHSIAAVLAGSGVALTSSSSGTATVTLSGVNTYTGATTIGSGTTIKLGAAGVISDSSAVTANGTLDLNSYSETIGSLAGSGTVTSSAAGTPTLTLGGDNTSTTFSGAIQNGSGTVSIYKSGTGVFTLSGSNSYTGATTVPYGQIKLGAAQTNLTAYNISSGAFLDLGGYSATVGSLAGAGSVTSTASGSITITAGGDNTTTTFSGIIQDGSGTVAFTKAGTGTLTLSGTNTFSGGLIVSNGTLKVGAVGNSLFTPLGSYAGTVSVSNGGTLDLNGYTLGTSQALTINGAGYGSAGALTNTSVTAVTYSGLITLGSSSSIISSNGGITLSNTGTINGTGYTLTLGGTTTSGNTVASIIGLGTTGALTKTGAGTWILAGSNTYTGNTTISAGTLTVSGALSDSSAVVATGTYDLGSNDTILSLSGSGTVNLNSYILTAGWSSDTTYSGVLSGTGGLTKTGAGKLTLTNTQTFTGPLTISAGTIQISGTGSLGSGSYSGTITNNGTLQYSSSVDQTLSGNILTTNSGGALTKDTNTSTLTLSGSGSNFAGAVQISSGTVVALNASALGSSSGITVSDGAGLQLSGGIAVGNIPLTLSGNGPSSAGALSNISGTSSYAGAITLTTSAVRINSVAGTLALTGNITYSSFGLTIGGRWKYYNKWKYRNWWRSFNKRWNRNFNFIRHQQLYWKHNCFKWNINYI
jgi:fibronectin-binding autotransporter adhesin